MNTIFYFKHLKTVEEIKAHYRNLAKENHPDLGGNSEIMKEINGQYQAALKSCDGQRSEGREYKYKPDIEQELMDKLFELLKLRDLEIALIGYWIWVSGDTKRNRNALKETGLQWNSKRKRWYYKPKEWRRTYQSKGNLADLASKYGYRGFQTAKEEKMPATV